MIIDNPNNKIFYDSLKSVQRLLPKNQDIKYNSDQEAFVEFFNENEYFQRPPRFKRCIEEKTFKIDPPPPSPINKNEMPFIYTMCSMMLMGMISLTYGGTAIMNVLGGKSTFGENATQIIMCFAMLGGTLIFPILQRLYIKINTSKKERKRKRKHKNYIESKKMKYYKK